MTEMAIENVRLAEAFDLLRKWIAECSAEQVGAMLYKLKNQAIIVRLDVSEARDAFKLFETINNRGLRLSPTDIIKNFILGNAARFGAMKLDYAKDRWAELIRNLDGINSETFFRQFMISQLKNPVTMSSVVEHFQSLFMKEVQEAESLPDRGWYYDTKSEPEGDEADEVVLDSGVEAILEDEEENGDENVTSKLTFTDFLNLLVAHSRAYREIVFGLTGVPKLDRRLRNLRLIKSVPSYGFLMTMRVKRCDDSVFEQLLKLTEAFLLRRHICRERTNDNDTVFARLCAVDPNSPMEEVVRAYQEYDPGDTKFESEFATADFGASLIDRARYCLERIEMHLHGRHEELFIGGADSVHVEHIIPQKIKTKKAKSEFGDWPTYLGSDSVARHPRFVSRLGNLSLFAGELNIGASNNPYERKKPAYSNSAIKLTNSLPSEYPEFRFEQVELRSQALARLAVKLWPAV
jgi:hypothetical protein